MSYLPKRTKSEDLQEMRDAAARLGENTDEGQDLLSSKVTVSSMEPTRVHFNSSTDCATVRKKSPMSLSIFCASAGDELRRESEDQKHRCHHTILSELWTVGQQSTYGQR
jgi:hypothetical protein